MQPSLTKYELAGQLGIAKDQVEAALEHLEAQGRIRRQAGRTSVEAMVVPVGASVGWEAAVFDHFQTECVAIATKLSRGQVQALADDTTGGATLSFDIDDDHPFRDEVRGLLASVRAQANELWERVEAHNAQHPPEGARRVRFYVGQVESLSEDESC